MKAINNRIDSYRDDVKKLQQGLTSIPALGPDNGGDGEYKKAEYLMQVLKEYPYDFSTIIEAPDDRVPSGHRPNLILKYNGQSHHKTIWIMAHLDVVPPGDLSNWETDPWKVVEKEGKLYGRGTEDNQQGLVSAVMAVKALMEENVRPQYDVGLAFVADEETGSNYGIKYVLDKRADLFGKDDIIIIPDAGDAEGVEIEVAEKSILWVRVETSGKQTHGSTPEKGANAHKAAAHLIVKMNELYSVFNDQDALYDPPISTFEPTQKEVNVTNVNTIPGKDVFYFDCRILPHYNLEDVKKQIGSWTQAIESEFGVTIDITYPQDEPAPPATPADTPAALAIIKAVKDVTGKEAKTLGIGGGTVAAYFREKHLPAVCWCTLDDTLHAPNEYSSIDNTLTDAKVFAHIFMQE